MLLHFLVNLLYSLVGAAVGFFVCVGITMLLWMVFREDMISILDEAGQAIREDNPDNIVIVERYLRSKFK